jgi:hypothetical protein
VDHLSTSTWLVKYANLGASSNSNLLIMVYGAFLISCQTIGLLWCVSVKEWVGLYRNQEDKLMEWVVSASYFKEFSFSLVQFSIVCIWAFSINPISGRNILPLVKLNHMLRLWNLPHHSHGGYHKLGWTFSLGSVKPNSTYSLKSWINFSLTRRGGGGLRLLPSWHI